MGKYVLEWQSHGAFNASKIGMHGLFVADKLPQITKYLRKFTYCVNGNGIRTSLIEDGRYCAIGNARGGYGSYSYTIRYDRDL